uniref:Ribosomal protein S3 n=1 Tax=Rhexinema sarcinoideum TaxID=43261 RepID=A0A1B2RYV2_9CHLO|nr:ribosomal protein S3 [Rhexinema sarcinoideum]
MNTSSFIYFYLHLASQKAQFSLTLNDQVSFKLSSQPLYAKQSLTLLSLKGLKKKSDLFKVAAFAAWKQAVGYSNLVPLPFFSHPQFYQLNMKYKALTRFQNLNFSKKKQNTEKNFYPISRKINEKAAFLPFSLTSNCKFNQQRLPFRPANLFGGKTKMLSKVKTKRKLISTLYQKILNQSFKKNFIDHLKKIENLTKIKTYGKPKLLNIRSDHQMEFFSWTPTLNKTKVYSNFLKATTAFKASTKTKKINTSLADRDKNRSLPFENYMMLSNLTLNNSVQKKKLKTVFDFLQLEAVKIKQDHSTKYMCASWLLEFIRAELSFRNANLKRVLNNLFLYTRQPICNFTPSKQAVPFALPFQRPSEKTKPILVNSNHSLFVVPDLIKGLRVTFSGRLGGKKGMAKTLTKTTGRVPLSTLKEKVDFAKGVVHTKNGSLGIKVWICFN